MSRGLVNIVVITGLSINALGCSSLSSTGGSLEITPGSDTTPYAATYAGTLTSTVDFEHFSSSSPMGSYTQTVRVTVGSSGELTLHSAGYEATGVIDSSGNWKVEVDLALLGEAAKEGYEPYGCTSSDHFARITGVADGHSLSGTLFGSHYCWQLVIPTVELESAGTLTATR